MTIHIVCWTMKNLSDKNENMHRIKQMLEALPGKIPQIRALSVGLGAWGSNPLCLSGSEYDVVLTAMFDSASALAEYDANPEHIKVKSFIESVTAKHITFDKSF